MANLPANVGPKEQILNRFAAGVFCEAKKGRAVSGSAFQ